MGDTAWIFAAPVGTVRAFRGVPFRRHWPKRCLSTNFKKSDTKAQRSAHKLVGDG